MIGRWGARGLGRARSRRPRSRRARLVQDGKDRGSVRTGGGIGPALATPSRSAPPLVRVLRPLHAATDRRNPPGGGRGDEARGHPKDRHVLAAAIEVDANQIVTNILTDLLEDYPASFGSAAKSTDDFSADFIDLDQETPVTAFRELVLDGRNPENGRIGCIGCAATN